MNPLSVWRGMERNDRYFLLSSILVPLIVWWCYKGRHKYGTKGMR